MGSLSKNKKYLLPVLLLALAIFLIAPAGCRRKETGGAGGTPAPDFSLKDTSGKSYKLSSLKGKVVIMEFMATWCPACIASVPDNNKLYNQFKDKGAVILAVSVDEGAGADAKVKEFIKSYKVAYPILLDNKDTAAVYRVMSIPNTFLIDKDGNIVRHYMGFSVGTVDLLAAEINGLLNK